MKRIRLILVVVFVSMLSKAQEIPSSVEQQLENLTGMEESETEDDSYLQQLEDFRKNPLNLNVADINELRELRILTDLQINSLIAYRRLFGKFIHIYELQAIPAWDVQTVKKLLPFVTIYLSPSLKNDLAERFTGGNHSLLIRWSKATERSKAYDKSNTGTRYLGGPHRLFFRYRYAYKNLLQWGVVGDKDAGEQFFKGSQKRGFDFYSFHVLIRKIGIVQALVLGDFTVNMGQGLIQWQSLAFKKSVDVMNVKRQSAMLRPYNSAGEFNFNRGIGITIQKRNVEATAFASFRKLSANIVADTNHFSNYVSSFLVSGYHRTETEMADKNNLGQISFGSSVKYNGHRWHIAANGVYYHFSLPVQKKEEPYNLFAISGKSWYNISVDYHFTYRNMHYFGEAAMDQNAHPAFLNGILISVDPKVDISIVQRVIAKNYQAVNANAFTENTAPTNESGLYAGITIRPSTAWRLDLYADLYKFSWLKFQVDAPGGGRDCLAQLTYIPNRQVEIYTRFKNEVKQGNQPGNATPANFLVPMTKKNWRTQVNYAANRSITLRNRIEMVWFEEGARDTEKGFLSFFDFLYKPPLKAYSGVIRLQYFETDSYDSRLYAYESDVLYSYSIPVFYEKGYRYYITLHYDFTKALSVWMRWAQTAYRDKTAIGSGPDEVAGNKRSDLRIQARLIF